MQITELDLKIKYIISFKERLELFDKILPELVQDIRVLYFDTYDSQLDFWSDKNSLIQRLDAYEDFLNSADYKEIKELTNLRVGERSGEPVMPLFIYANYMTCGYLARGIMHKRIN